MQKYFKMKYFARNKAKYGMHASGISPLTYISKANNICEKTCLETNSPYMHS